jgi:hypothetical protein
MAAANVGAFVCAEQLLAAGADANAASTRPWNAFAAGSTALMVAARRGMVRVCKTLLAAGADPRRADAQGHIPIEHVSSDPLRRALARSMLFESSAPLLAAIQSGRGSAGAFGTSRLFDRRVLRAVLYFAFAIPQPPPRGPPPRGPPRAYDDDID